MGKPANDYRPAEAAPPPVPSGFRRPALFRAFGTEDLVTLYLKDGDNNEPLVGTTVRFEESGALPLRRQASPTADIVVFKSREGAEQRIRLSQVSAVERGNTTQLRGLDLRPDDMLVIARGGRVETGTFRGTNADGDFVVQFKDRIEPVNRYKLEYFTGSNIVEIQQFIEKLFTELMTLQKEASEAVKDLHYASAEIHRVQSKLLEQHSFRLRSWFAGYLRAHPGLAPVARERLEIKFDALRKLHLLRTFGADPAAEPAVNAGLLNRTAEVLGRKEEHYEKWKSGVAVEKIYLRSFKGVVLTGVAAGIGYVVYDRKKTEPTPVPSPSGTP